MLQWHLKTDPLNPWVMFMNVHELVHSKASWCLICISPLRWYTLIRFRISRSFSPNLNANLLQSGNSFPLLEVPNWFWYFQMTLITFPKRWLIPLTSKICPNDLWREKFEIRILCDTPCVNIYALCGTIRNSLWKMSFLAAKYPLCSQ